MKRLVVLAMVPGLLLMGCGQGGTEPPSLTPTTIVWILQAPKGREHGLWTKEALTDESCANCLLGGLPAGTKLAPANEGCLQAAWDTSYVYCHVQVLDGDLAGSYGWVNQEFIKR